LRNLAAEALPGPSTRRRKMHEGMRRVARVVCYTGRIRIRCDATPKRSEVSYFETGHYEGSQWLTVNHIPRNYEILRCHDRVEEH
jgi:hypothetical protein